MHEMFWKHIRHLHHHGHHAHEHDLLVVNVSIATILAFLRCQHRQLSELWALGGAPPTIPASGRGAQCCRCADIGPRALPATVAVLMAAGGYTWRAFCCCCMWSVGSLAAIVGQEGGGECSAARCVVAACSGTLRSVWDRALHGCWAWRRCCLVMHLNVRLRLHAVRRLSVSFRGPSLYRLYKRAGHVHARRVTEGIADWKT